MFPLHSDTLFSFITLDILTKHARSAQHCSLGLENIHKLTNLCSQYISYQLKKMLLLFLFFLLNELHWDTFKVIFGMGRQCWMYPSDQRVHDQIYLHSLCLWAQLLLETRQWALMLLHYHEHAHCSLFFTQSYTHRPAGAK